MAEILFDIPENPSPDWGGAGFFTTVDGIRIRYAVFPAQKRPLKGTVVILPGRNECIEKYFETVRDLSARGLGSAILDWRGQGGSGRLIADPARGYVGSFDDYVRDLGQFFEEVVLPDCRGPYYVLAHSTGALIALLAASDLVNRVRRMVLLSPLLELTGLPVSMRTVRRVAGLLYNLGFGTAYMAGGARPREGYGFAGNKLTSDRARFLRNAVLYEKAPQLAAGGPTVAWLRAACDAAEAVQVPEFMARLNLPLLMVAAGFDRVVATDTIERYALGLRTASCVTIDGARHEILQEADLYREQFFAAFDAFIPGSGPD
jgi:lysophospholipase